MKIAVIGTGAVGGYYGGLFAQQGHEVHFLLNSDYEHVKQNGLKVDSPNGNFTLNKINAWNKVEDMPVCELVLITLKTTSNHLLPKILPPICNEKSKILVLQNGLDTDADVAKIVPDSRIFGGLCFLCSNKIGPGHIQHLNYGTIRMGEYLRNGKAARITDSLKEISTLFESINIPVDLSPDIIEARWRKLVWNIPFNGLCAVLKKDTKTLVTNPETRELVISIMKEVLLAAKACGKKIEDEFIDQMMALTDNMGPYKPSMMLDSEAGRPMEVREMYLRPLENAQRSNCSTPLIAKLAAQLQFFDD